MGKRLADMTPDERSLAIRRAAAALEIELRANAERIAAVLDSPPDDETPEVTD